MAFIEQWNKAKTKPLETKFQENGDSWKIQIDLPLKFLEKNCHKSYVEPSDFKNKSQWPPTGYEIKMAEIVCLSTNKKNSLALAGLLRIKGHIFDTSAVSNTRLFEAPNELIQYLLRLYHPYIGIRDWAELTEFETQTPSISFTPWVYHAKTGWPDQRIVNDVFLAFSPISKNYVYLLSASFDGAQSKPDNRITILSEIFRKTLSTLNIQRNNEPFSSELTNLNPPKSFTVTDIYYNLEQSSDEAEDINHLLCQGDYDDYIDFFDPTLVVENLEFEKKSPFIRIPNPTKKHATNCQKILEHIEKRAEVLDNYLKTFTKNPDHNHKKKSKA